jgi:hypothetical protein
MLKSAKGALPASLFPCFEEMMGERPEASFQDLLAAVMHGPGASFVSAFHRSTKIQFNSQAEFVKQNVSSIETPESEDQGSDAG